MGYSEYRMFFSGERDSAAGVAGSGEPLAHLDECNMDGGSQLTRWILRCHEFSIFE